MESTAFDGNQFHICRNLALKNQFWAEDIVVSQVAVTGRALVAATPAIRSAVVAQRTAGASDAADRKCCELDADRDIALTKPTALCSADKHTGSVAKATTRTITV